MSTNGTKLGECPKCGLDGDCILDSLLNAPDPSEDRDQAMVQVVDSKRCCGVAIFVEYVARSPEDMTRKLKAQQQSLGILAAAEEISTTKQMAMAAEGLSDADLVLGLVDSRNWRHALNVEFHRRAQEKDITELVVGPHTVKIHKQEPRTIEGDSYIGVHTRETLADNTYGDFPG